MSNERPEDSPAEDPVVITPCPNGPLLVRGDALILDGDGLPVPRRRATVALCRCGASAIQPYCDGTHKVARRGRVASESNGEG